MASNLQSRAALLLLPGIFLIPIGVSALGDLTHVVTCNQEAKTPFTVVVPKSGPPVLLGTTRLTRGQNSTLCGGLTLNLGVRPGPSGDVTLIVPIKNDSKYVWRGTVKLQLGDVSVPVNIGSVPPGKTKTDSVDVHLGEGSHEVHGSLLIGP
jgi:hypothetical protein